MHAELLPLEGKYYGTRICITDDAGLTYEIKLWNDGSHEPSDRQLAGRCTIEEWRRNAMIRGQASSRLHPEGVPARELVEVCDSHFESRETHAMALEIVVRMNAG